MVLKFDDIIYKNNFEIHAKDEIVNIEIAISDVESEELTNLMLGLLKGESDNGRIDAILFKDNLEKLKEVLIGFNYSSFQKAVLQDFQNFMSDSIKDITKKVNGL